MNLNDPRVQAGIKRYGSEEAYREALRAAQKKSRENYSGTGGFAALSPEERKRIAQLGVNSRAKKKQSAKDNDTTTSQD